MSEDTVAVRKYDLYRLHENIGHMIACEEARDSEKLEIASSLVEGFVRDHVKMDYNKIQQRAQDDAEREWC